MEKEKKKGKNGIKIHKISSNLIKNFVKFLEIGNKLLRNYL